MSKSVNASRIVGLMVLLMAAVVLLSGPVAEVLDLPSPAAEAKKKHKHKKKKKKHKPQFNVVQCPTEDDGRFCFGSPFNDFLVGGPEDRPDGAFDQILGGEGTDVYNGGNGSDALVDFSNTSSDVYLLPASDFGEVAMLDFGGDGDIVGLSSYRIEDFTVSEEDGALILDGPGDRRIGINEFVDAEEDNFGFGKIEFFLFSEGLASADEFIFKAQQTTAEEDAGLNERLSQVESSSRAAAQKQQEKEASSA